MCLLQQSLPARPGPRTPGWVWLQRPAWRARQHLLKFGLVPGRMDSRGKRRRGLLLPGVDLHLLPPWCWRGAPGKVWGPEGILALWSVDANPVTWGSHGTQVYFLLLNKPKLRVERRPGSQGCFSAPTALPGAISLDLPLRAVLPGLWAGLPSRLREATAPIPPPLHSAVAGSGQPACPVCAEAFETCLLWKPLSSTKPTPGGSDQGLRAMVPTPHGLGLQSSVCPRRAARGLAVEPTGMGLCLS